MDLKINNQLKNFEQDTISVQELLDLERPNKQNGIAIGVNGSIVSKTHWENTFLFPTDDILIITATQGG